MKKNGLLFVALAAIAAGIYFATKGRRTAVAGKVGTTGTAGATPTSFWDALIGKAASNAGQTANRAVYGSSSGGAGGADLSPLIKAGAKTASDLASRWFGKLFGGSSTTTTTAPGTSTGYGTTNSGDFSTWEDYRAAQVQAGSEGGGFNGPSWIPDGSPYLFGSDEGSEPQPWNNESDLPLDDAYNDATSEEEFFSRN